MSYDPSRITGYAGDRMTEYEIECLAFHMPAVAERATDEWVKGFAKSIARQSRRKGWRPTAKQAPLMRRLVADLFNHQDGAEVIDAAD